MVWLVAYLVLVEGLVQFGLSRGWQQLGLPTDGLALLAFLFYNIGNGAVMSGRILKSRLPRALSLINLGGALLAVSMLLLAYAVRHTAFSWNLAWFLGLVVIILVSMPVGLLLSARRSNK
jgi:hypothetical protein